MAVRSDPMATTTAQLTNGAASPGRRLSVCYVAPGQHLLASAGPTRNVLNLATSLADFADVTVAFRTVIDEPGLENIDVLQIDTAMQNDGAAVLDDAAVRGVGAAEFARYTMAVRRFVRRELRRFDLVFEKSWTLSGLVAAECRKYRIPAIVVENLVPSTSGGTAATGFVKRAKIQAAKVVAGWYLRKAGCIIAETDVLKNAMVEQWHIPERRISVVPLGVDRGTFAPGDQASARAELGISPTATILLYSGVVDATHNLRPIVTVLSRSGLRDVELHVIGDGIFRAELERLAAGGTANIRFHGRVPYALVPRYIAAADLCLAPYEPSAFPGGQVAYSSLKIPEYMSAGRPVVSVPSGRVLDLVTNGVTGFLFANTEEDWTRFLADLPDRRRLSEMGAAAAESGLDSWHDVARSYLEIGRRQLASRESNS